MSIHDEAHHAVNAELEAETRYTSGDAVARPHYYQAVIDNEPIQVLDIVEAYDLPPHLFDAMIYLMRAGKKDHLDELKDLEKALFYVRRWVSHYKSWYMPGDQIDYERLRKYPPVKVMQAFGIDGARAIACEAIMMVHSDSSRPIKEVTSDGVISAIFGAIEEYHLRHRGTRA